MRLGIVGSGNVGGCFGVALEQAGHEVMYHDVSTETLKKYKRTTTSLKELVQFAEAVFVCVPTEDDGTGKCDMSIFNKVADEIASYEAEPWCKTRVFVQRSTVSPGTADAQSVRFKKIKYVVNPSFLVMATKEKDSWQPDKVTLGIYAQDVEELAPLMRDEIYRWMPKEKIHISSPIAIEVAKYTENALQSTLLSFWNNVLLVAREAGAEAQMHDILQIISLTPDLSVTPRIPGKAFGGACLPKDIRALITWCKERGVPCPVFQGVKDMNAHLEATVGVNTKSAVDLYRVTAGKFEIL